MARGYQCVGRASARWHKGASSARQPSCANSQLLLQGPRPDPPAPPPHAPPNPRRAVRRVTFFPPVLPDLSSPLHPSSSSPIRAFRCVHRRPPFASQRCFPFVHLLHRVPPCAEHDPPSWLPLAALPTIPPIARLDLYSTTNTGATPVLLRPLRSSMLGINRTQRNAQLGSHGGVRSSSGALATTS